MQAEVDELALTFGQDSVQTREQLLSAIDEILASAKATLIEALKDGQQTSDYLFETMVASIQMIRNYLGATKDEKVRIGSFSRSMIFAFVLLI